MISSTLKSTLCNLMEEKIVSLLTNSIPPGDTEMSVCQTIGIYLQLYDGLSEGKSKDDLVANRPNRGEMRTNV